MFYIHQSTCISPQQTFGNVDLSELKLSANNQLHAIEPKYEAIPPGHLRRMGVAVRMGVGSGLPLLLQNKVDGIIIGTANGGIEDSVKFLNQIIDYNEGTLTPTHFVQSTYNAIAGQLGLITKNTGYNITHVHRGLAFENAALDVAMLLSEYPEKSYLVGGVDEISVRNYHMECLQGLYKKEPVLNSELFDHQTIGTMPGEGAAMFVVNNSKEDAVARLTSLKMFYSGDENVVHEQLELFLKENLKGGDKIDLYLSGENGDTRLLQHFDACENLMDEQTTIARFKHLTGEFQTATAVALWLVCNILQTQKIPRYMIKKDSEATRFKRVLIYNNYKGTQHSFMLVERVTA